MTDSSAILLGSISTVVDTSELQRQAFNDAFARHGLDWHWDRETYLALLERNGGRDRIAAAADSAGQDVDADAVHATKSEIFRELLGSADVSPRPGVVDTVRAARAAGGRVGLVTTTSAENVAALLAALDGALTADDFDVVVDTTMVEQGKPDPAAYRYALDALGVAPEAAVAVEDNVGGVDAARAAGLACLAFPNANTAAHDFSAATRRVERLDPDEVRALTPAG